MTDGVVLEAFYFADGQNFLALRRLRSLSGNKNGSDGGDQRKAEQ
jgi:hypothetical protein